MAVIQATVFGGSGFLGRYAVKRLAEAGARVVAAVRHPERAGFLKPMGAVGQIAPVAADIGDAAAVAAALRGSDLAVNLVGILAGSRRRSFAAIHVDGARRVAEAAAAAGATRLVHVSALGADAASPSAYARSKAAGEAAVRAAFPGAVILRPGVLVGPEDRFLNRFAALARVVPALPLVHGGRTRMQPVYVRDAAEALASAATHPDAAGRTYELGGPTVYSFRELLEYTLATTGRRALLMPLPEWLLALKARVFELLPEPPLTRDQIALLRRDNVVSDGEVGRFGDLGVEPAPLESVAPEWLARHRRGGAREGARRRLS